jgi:tetratricopeptide (TPR) repeat protein
MRHLIILSILNYFVIAVSAQNISKSDTSLKFDRRYTQCEKKWVVRRPDSTGKYTFGYIYIDSQAGFTFDFKGNFIVDKNNRYIVDTSVSQGTSIKVRLYPNWGNIAVLPVDRFKELGIKPEPNWIKGYYSYTDTVAHNFRWGFIYNDLDQCDTALAYLKKAYAVQPHYKGLEFELIFAYNALRRFDEAISIINSAIKADPKNVLFYRELGYAYQQNKDYDRSVATYMQGIEMCTDKEIETKSEMAINMANSYKSLGKNEEYKIWGAKAKSWATPGSALYKFIVSQGF